MSNQVNTYVMYGYFFPEFGLRDKVTEVSGEDAAEQLREDLSDSAFESVTAGDLYWISDGMDGEFEALGVLLDRTDNYEHFSGRANTQVTTKIKKKLNDAIKKNFPSLQETLLKNKPELLVFSLWR